MVLFPLMCACGSMHIWISNGLKCSCQQHLWIFPKYYWQCIKLAWLLSSCLCQNSILVYLGSMTIGWHRLARHCSVENMLIWWYHTLNWFIRHSVCKYFCPTHTRASRCCSSEAWIRTLQWPAAKRSLLQWRTAAVERILDKLGDKEWEKT